MFVTVNVRRHGDEYVTEDLAVAQIARVSPPSAGEGGAGCRITLASQPVTLQLRETREELAALVWEQYNGAPDAVLSDTRPNDEDETYRRALQKARDHYHPAMRWAEGIIRQLPIMHDGRNSWLANHGTYTEADIASALEHGQGPGSAFPPPPHGGTVTGDVRQLADHLGVVFQAVYRHTKRQTHYGLLGFGRVQVTGFVEDGDVVALYCSLDGVAADGNDLWVRPREEFLDGRFTLVKP